MSGVRASDVTTVVVIGASGFVGEHLLNALVERKDIELRVLVHRNKAKNHPRCYFLEGDLLKPETLDALLSKDCTVINLAYLAQKNLEAMANLASACARNQVRRLIHCSTAVVAGKAAVDQVSESTPCIPTSEYEQIKLQMEKILLEAAIGRFELSILRPTAVFGPGGKNLLKLANELLTGNIWVSYIRSCLFSRRSMNLVAVENVIAALEFLLDAKNVNREIFIISDDNFPINNYRDIENRLLANFGKSYLIPRAPIPKIFLRAILRLSGKSNTNPSIKYSDQKLAALGFNKPRSFGEAIDAFAEWHKNSSKKKSTEHAI